MTFQQVNIPVTDSITPASGSPETQPKSVSAAPPTSSPQEQAAPSSAGDRPSWLPEKFKSAEEMAKAYSELEKKQSGKLDQIDPNKSIDFEPYSKEFTETGDLSQESMQKLEKSGIPSEMIRQYIDGAKALAEQQVTALTSEIGGREVYSTMIGWAASNLSAEEIAAYNKAVSDPQQRALAVRGLYSKYKESAGPSLVQGRASGASTVAPFESWAQVKDAMKDRRYMEDPAYRKQVADRLASSNL